VIALDTNVLLRVFINDDATRHAKAKALVLAHRALPGEPPRLHVPVVVLCETVWNLESVFRRPKVEILKVLDAILVSRDIDVAARDEVQSATRRFRDGKGDFADYLIHELAIRAGCESVVTFETILLREHGFIAP